MERDPSDLANNNLHMSEEWAAVAEKASGMLVCINSRDKKDNCLAQLSACQAISAILFSVLISAVQKRSKQAGEIPGKGHKAV